MTKDPYKVTFESWDKVASLYQETFMDLSLYNDTYDAFCELVTKKGARIFEIGCGPGNITKYVLSKRPDFDLKAIDVSPNMLRLAKENNPSARFKLMDCRETGRMRETYDGIICGFCMPYLSKEDCVRLVENCSLLLNQGGIFYFSTIEGDYSKSGYETSSKGADQMYVYYYEETFLLDQLRKNGFAVTDFQRKGYAKADGSRSEHLIFIARKVA